MHDARYDPDEMTAYDLPAERSTPVQVRVTATGRGEHPTIAAASYDLRTLPEREAAAVAALALRCDSLAEQVAVLSRRVDALERDNDTLRTVVHWHGDWMQLRELRGEDAK